MNQGGGQDTGQNDVIEDGGPFFFLTRNGKHDDACDEDDEGIVVMSSTSSGCSDRTDVTSLTDDVMTLGERDADADAEIDAALSRLEMRVPADSSEISESFANIGPSAANDLTNMFCASSTSSTTSSCLPSTPTSSSTSSSSSTACSIPSHAYSPVSPSLSSRVPTSSSRAPTSSSYFFDYLINTDDDTTTRCSTQASHHPKPQQHRNDVIRTENQDGGGGVVVINSFEDREFDFLRSKPVVQRSTSLKPVYCKGSSALGKPGSGGMVGRRKSVRFADALGLDLASIRHIMNPDEPPTVPTAILQTHERDGAAAAAQRPDGEEIAFWRVRFQQPVIASPDFVQRVRDRMVALESCSVNNHDLKVHGVVRVANIAYNKDVFVRFTENGWLTSMDVRAKYITNSNDLHTDRFYFVFNVPGHLGVRSRLEFAVCFSANDQTWWDNNLGYNYSLDCIHYLGYE